MLVLVKCFDIKMVKSPPPLMQPRLANQQKNRIKKTKTMLQICYTTLIKISSACHVMFLSK